MSDFQLFKALFTVKQNKGGCLPHQFNCLTKPPHIGPVDNVHFAGWQK